MTVKLRLERPLSVRIAGKNQVLRPGIHEELPEDVLNDDYVQDWIAAGYALELQDDDAVPGEKVAELEYALELATKETSTVVAERDQALAELETLKAELVVLRAASAEASAMAATKAELEEVREKWRQALDVATTATDALVAVEAERDALRAAAAKTTTAKAGK